MQRLQGKTAVITGGTSGIGLAAAQDFLSEGAQVIITGRYRDSLEKTVEKLGEGAYGIVSDAGDITHLQQLQAQVSAIFPKVDILFVNAGYGRFAPVEAVTPGMVDELMNMMVKGAVFTVQALLPLMGEGGSIILNTSVVTQYGSSYASVYSAAKAAVASLVKTLAAECTAKGIRVNGVSPGYTATDGFNKTGMPQEQIEATIKAVTEILPFKRFARPEEIAKAVSFLASEDASYVHAAELVVDGGYSMIR